MIHLLDGREDLLVERGECLLLFVDDAGRERRIFGLLPQHGVAIGKACLQGAVVLVRPFEQQTGPAEQQEQRAGGFCSWASCAVMRAKFQSKRRRAASRTIAKCVRQALASADPSSIELIFERVPTWEIAALQISVMDAIKRPSGGRQALQRSEAPRAHAVQKE
jgi:hypothetical protein